MSEVIKDRRDKECNDKINQLEKERKPIIYIEIRHNGLETSNISKNKKHFFKKHFFVTLL